MNRTEAEAAGFTVDDTTYPWTAYKGPRFRPDECRSILTPEWAPTDNKTFGVRH